MSVQTLAAPLGNPNPDWCTKCTPSEETRYPFRDGFILDEAYVVHQGVLFDDHLTDIAHDATRVQIVRTRLDELGNVGPVGHTVRIGDVEYSLTGRLLDVLQKLVDSGRAVLA